MSTYEFLNLVTLAIGTFIAGAVAIGGIITQRKIARQKNTLDFHEKYISQEYDQDFNVIANIYRDKEKTPLADYAERKGGPERKALMNMF